MLPFIAGIAAGAVAVVAINNRKEIKEKAIVGASKVKEQAIVGATKVQEKATDVKNCVVSKVEKLKTKDEKVVIEETSNAK